MLNVAVLMGRLVADPQLRQTPAGKKVCSFRIAVNRNYTGQDGKQQADFFDIVAWEQRAEFVCKYFQKGSLIAISGRLETRSWTDKNGQNRSRVEIVANDTNFAGSKRDNQSAQSGGYDSSPNYGTPNCDDFAVIEDNDDLPF